MLKRHPAIAYQRVPLSEERHAVQVQRGLYVVERGERLAVPVDHQRRPTVYLNRELWRRTDGVTHRPGVRLTAPGTDAHRRVLAWLRDNVHEGIPRAYYMATLGHDLHVSTFGDLYARHWHRGWVDPFTHEQAGPLDPTFATCPELIEVGALGFIESIGWISGGKVTTAFVSEEIDELVSAAGSEYADFDSHEVGTSADAEANSDTALIATTGISRAAGTPSDVDPIYRSVGTITADAVETWEEHGLFNNTSGAALMDRSLTGGQAVVVSDQVEYTYQLTKNAEA